MGRWSFTTVLSAAAGVLLFDYLFCGKVAPKLFQRLSLAPEKGPDCHCGGGCQACAKNVTDRAQVIDVTPLNEQVPAS
jgi:hypothetical protein